MLCHIRKVSPSDYRGKGVVRKTLDHVRKTPSHILSHLHQLPRRLREGIPGALRYERMRPRIYRLALQSHSNELVSRIHIIKGEQTTLQLLHRLQFSQ
eukprot:CAMPEP_0179417196 /NCGR_PEP_ID=MMETSP0799-20121207/7233_1 /TAXON_ID=46947 /ORGANISM="Geminigera cryophila, Strain CCMP2564" /LENGTH=97 /DNA_ID=CAMNT_0021190179 /DNA_START=93 /DNA_END=386 /DNA_ORIENTATION=-